MLTTLGGLKVIPMVDDCHTVAVDIVLKINNASTVRISSDSVKQVLFH